MSWKIRKRVLGSPGFSIIFFGDNSVSSLSPITMMFEWSWKTIFYQKTPLICKVGGAHERWLNCWADRQVDRNNGIYKWLSLITFQPNTVVIVWLHLIVYMSHSNSILTRDHCYFYSWSILSQSGHRYFCSWNMLIVVKLKNCPK